MAAIDWPATLPAMPDQGGNSLTLANKSLRAPITPGKPQVRQRSNAVPDPYKVMLLLTKAQVATLSDFYCGTLAYGALRFNWKDQAGTVAEIRFMKPPEVSVAGGEVFRADLEIEVMP